MKIIHHFGINISLEKDARMFAAAGIDIERGPANLPGSRIASFEIAEDDPRWEVAQRLAGTCKITDFVRTEFSEMELKSASALCIFASGHRGYPEPSKGLGFLESTYDLSEYCIDCGMGLRQVRPFQIGFTPDLRRTFMQLNWVFDEFFIGREVWAEVFEPLGVKCWPVQSSKTGDTLDTIVQLQISERTRLKLEGEPQPTCSRCRRVKSPMELRGFAPSPSDIPAPIFKSIEYFGSGRASFSRVFVSSGVYEAIRRTRLRGVQFYPCLHPGG